ncbi:PadR family transcriptional regulator [Methylobacillus flagellatus]|uniref:PadR family transcriptional regulator n=1 Tax=Methylobacillus flagellatus TaxID=405 RepID=UPI002853FE30|nr:PadR family transcriptional regulator [Methylobacillus flagellatus]MDR5172969.1 PadR family transcriptional regulator [Methylobacillus flagellatus]
MAKLTKAQRDRLTRIRKGCDLAGVCSDGGAGFPAWPIIARLADAGCIEIVEGEYGRWPMHPAKGYRITEAGRQALATQEQERPDER